MTSPRSRVRRAFFAGSLSGIGLATIAGLAIVPLSVASTGQSVTPPVAKAAVQMTTPESRFSDTAPNVVLITTDDQALDDMRFMPKTRRLLGDAGVTFSNALSPHPLCCPARAEILTGQFAGNNGVTTNGGPYGGYGALRGKGDTLPAWLADQGYETSMIGKFMNKWRPDEHGPPPGWTDFQASPVDSFGFYDFKIWHNGDQERYDNGTDYSTNYVTDATVDLINTWSTPEQSGTQAGQTRPFFIWSSYYAPHGDCSGEGSCKVPPTPERRYADAFPGEEPPSLSKPSFTATLDNPNPIVAGRPVVSTTQARHHFKERIRSLQSVDNGVESIINALKAQGVLDNTLIIFTSDNGYLIGEHRYIGKVVGYEEALRVPFLMRGPGITPGTVREQYATTVDIAPTIVEATGARPDREMDGRDLMPFVTGNAAGPDTVLIQAGTAQHDFEDGRWLFKGVRTDRWTYTKWRLPDGSKYEELFDRNNDPYQVDNLANERDYYKVEAELQRRTQKLANCDGPSECFTTFGEVPKPVVGTVRR